VEALLNSTLRYGSIYSSANSSYEGALLSMLYLAASFFWLQYLVLFFLYRHFSNGQNL
jgi:hypothetical protein